MPKKFIKSFRFAKAGAGHAIKTQRNLWIHFFIGLAVLGFAIWLRVSLLELALLIVTIFGVIVAEMVNTAIEELVKYTIDHRKLVYIITISFTIICLIGISKIKTSGNVVDDIPHNNPIYADLLFFEKYYKGVLPFEIQIDTKKENGLLMNNAMSLYKIRRLEKQLKKDKKEWQAHQEELEAWDATLLDGLEDNTGSVHPE